METAFKRFKYKVILPILLIFARIWNRSNTTLKLKNAPLFILGAGRNGSTLLALILNRHSEIFLPPEQSFLPYSIMRQKLAFRHHWKTYSNQVIEDFQNQNQDWKINAHWIGELKNELEQWPKEKQEIGHLYDYIVRSYGQRMGKNARCIGDHSPVTTFFYKLIFRQFPEANFIFLLRDPIDSSYSYSKMRENPASDPQFFTWKWNNSLKAYEWILKQKDAKIKMVRYEHLVSSPTACMEDLLDFLGLRKEDLISPKQNDADSDVMGAGERAHHQNLYKPISKNSIGKGHLEYDETSKKVVLQGTAFFAKKYGYNT